MEVLEFNFSLIMDIKPLKVEKYNERERDAKVSLLKRPNWLLPYFFKFSVLMMKGMEDIGDCDKLDNNLTKTLP